MTGPIDRRIGGMLLAPMGDALINPPLAAWTREAIAAALAPGARRAR